MKKFLSLIIVLLACISSSSAIADQADTEEILSYKQQIRTNPKDATAHINLGDAYIERGKYEEAIKEYEEAIHIKPNDANAHNKLGKAYAIFHRYEEAIKEFNEAIRIKPDYAEAHSNLINYRAILGKEQEAVQKYKEAVRKNPNNAEAHFNLGKTYFNLGKYWEAVKEYKETVRIKPNDVEAHIFLGLALGQLGNYQEATKEYKEAIRIRPDYAKGHANLGYTYDILGKYQEAIQEFKEAIRLEPDNANVHYKLGYVYTDLGKYQEASQEFKESIRIKPDNADAHFRLGAAYDNLGKYQEAAQEYKESIRISPDNPENVHTHAILGTIYYQLGKYQEAVQELKEVIRIKPNHVDVHNILGFTYDLLNDGSNAIVHTLIAAKLFEKAGDNAKTAGANKTLRELYAKHGYKPEDFASVKIPEDDRNPKPIPTVPTRSISLGTGVLFNQSAQVFTNYHVVHGAKYIKVKFVNGETIPATVSYKDEINDIAMLTLASQPKIQLKRIRLADSSNARVGEKVFTIGYPVSDILGKEPKYSEGTINSLSGMGDDAKMFQISVPIQAGNSGGPLFNERGEVLGLVTSTFSTNEASLLLSGAMPQNVNFAIKSSLFAEKALSQSKAIAPSSIVPIPIPFSIPDFVASVKNNIVLIEAE